MFLEGVCGSAHGWDLLFICTVNPLKCVKMLPTHYKAPATPWITTLMSPIPLQRVLCRLLITV